MLVYYSARMERRLKPLQLLAFCPGYAIGLVLQGFLIVRDGGLDVVNPVLLFFLIGIFEKLHGIGSKPSCLDEAILHLRVLKFNDSPSLKDGITD